MKILYTKYSKYRLTEFAVETQIIEKDKKKYVVKRAQNPEAIAHIKKFAINAELLKELYGDLLNVCNVNIKNDEAIFNYIEGKSFTQLLHKAIEDWDDNAVKGLLNLYLSFLKGENNEFIPFCPTDEYNKFFGSDFNFDKSIPAFKISNLDMGPSNLIFSNDKFTVIDYEWVYDFPIPKDFVYFRNLCVLLFYSGINLGKYTDIRDLCDKLDVKIDFDILNKMNISFHQSIFGKERNFGSKMADYNKFLKPSVRVDNGVFGGFCTVNFNCIGSDGDISPQMFEINDSVIDAKFFVPTDCNSITLNFNITEGISTVKDIRLDFDGKIYKPNIHNGLEIDDYYIFNEPPVFTFYVDHIVGDVCIFGNITNFINAESKLNYEVVTHLLSENSRKDEIIKNLNSTIEERNSTIEERNSTIEERNSTIERQNSLIKTQSVLLNAINNSNAWKSVKKIKNAKKKAKSILKPDFKPNPSLLDCGVGIIPFWWEFIESGVKIRDNLTCNIDYYEYSENKLYLRGFFFSEILNIEVAYLLITDGDNNVELPLNYGAQRKDVSEHLNNPGAVNSGFYGRYFLFLLKTAEMWLVLKNGGGIAQVYLGKVEPNTEFLTEKFLAAVDEYHANAYAESNPFSRIIDYRLNETSKLFEVPENFKADIIVYIYNDYDHLNDLFKSINNTNIEYRLIIINDKSSDQNVYPYLQTIAAENSETILIENDERLYFVESINKALKYAQNHAVLLNTDAELPQNWLERLLPPLFMGYASAAPFSNNGELLSFPNIDTDNRGFLDLSVKEIDDLFKDVIPAYTALPTGNGFCMAINHDVLTEIGEFDIKFKKDAAWAADWYRRAIEAGYNNAAVENLYIQWRQVNDFYLYENQLDSKCDMSTVYGRYPTSNSEIKEFIEKDPLFNIRLNIILKILSIYIKCPNVLIWNHSIGGGADSYIQNVIKDLVIDNTVWLIQYDISLGIYELCIFNITFKCIKCRLNTWDNLTEILLKNNFDEIYVNELYTYPCLNEVLNFISIVKEKDGSKLIFLMHDMYSVCYAFNLLPDGLHYCGLPDNIENCSACFNKIIDRNLFPNIDISGWRSMWGDFLRQTDQIKVFSNNSKHIFEKVYGPLEQISVVPHIVDYILPVNKERKSTKTINIASLGILNIHKGINVIVEMVKLAETLDLPIHFTVIGEAHAEFVSKYLTVTGKYNKEDLPDIALKNDIDIFFIPSIWPETFSYTTEEAMCTGLPVACFNLGAPAERVVKYKKGLVIDQINAKKALDEIMNFLKPPLLKDYMGDKRILFLADHYSYATRYRCEHLAQILMRFGVRSDFRYIDDLDDIDVEHYTTCIIYQMELSQKLDKIIEKFKMRGISVFYDLDYYVFDFDKIKNLQFLNSNYSEYKNFDNYCLNIVQCIKQSDQVITSTHTLKKLLEEKFKKPTHIVRNVASIKMAELSIAAKNTVKKNESEVVLGYFSGSQTNNADFLNISVVIYKIMKKYKNVLLHLTGPIEMPEKLLEFSGRIKKNEFVHYTELPRLIAEIDINLMPLEDTIFHASKSENKWIDAALVNVPTIATRNQELERVLENDKTAILCSDELEWYNALESLVTDVKLRTDIGNNANRAVMDHYMVNRVEYSSIQFLIE